MKTTNNSMGAANYLTWIYRHGKKSFEWWTDDALQRAVPDSYMGIRDKYGRVHVWIACPPELWFKAFDVAKFLDKCRKTIGKDAAILNALIVCDRKLNSYLYWSEDAVFWSECEMVLANWRQLQTPPAKYVCINA